ncbi:MAG: T9SS type A sorting domain-containing protein, partial [Chitinophagaceae bacterium]
RVSQNNDDCATAFTKHTTAFITPSFAGNYDANNKMIEFEATYLSTFYLHGGDKALVALPGLTGKTAVSAGTENENSINVFPNPFKDKFTLMVNENTNCTYSFLLTDMQGHTLQSVEKQMVKGMNTVSFNCGNLAPGIYLMKIQTPGKIEFRKLIKL